MSGSVPAAVLILSRGVIRSMLTTKLTTWASASMTLGVVAAGAGALVGQEAASPKREGPANPALPRGGAGQRQGEEGEGRQ